MAVWHTVTLPRMVELYIQPTVTRALLREGESLHKGMNVALAHPIAIWCSGEEKLAARVVGRKGPPAFVLLDDVNLPWLTAEANERLMAD